MVHILERVTDTHPHRGDLTKENGCVRMYSQSGKMIGLTPYAIRKADSNETHHTGRGAT